MSSSNASVAFAPTNGLSELSLQDRSREKNPSETPHELHPRTILLSPAHLNERPLHRLQQYFERAADTQPHAVALVCHGQELTYQQLDKQANQLAHSLIGRGLGPGAKLGVFIERSVLMYVALLAIPKAGAAFVPIDPSAPPERVQYICQDAGLDAVLTTSDRAITLNDLPVHVVAVDELTEQIALAPHTRPMVQTQSDPLAYIIYTSGSTGRPKGVMIHHSSICNFVAVAAQIYGMTAKDRIYQGMSISFDFSLEEIWVTYAAGATLVAGPTDGRKVGSGLADFLDEHAVTFLHAVPTVLATIDRVLPGIHTLNLGGEACPQELVERWGGPHRRILNTYGPTEATASCTWAELVPGKPVTIGKPLPTYFAVILDENLQPVTHGQVGELCIGGVGVAAGYINRPELTAQKFIDLPTGQRIYRTGDLARVNPDGEVDYLGRADSEIKIRGHRVDLGEIESVLQEEPTVQAAVVNLINKDNNGGQLAAYLLPTSQAVIADEDRAALHAMLRQKMPPYMVPDFIDVIDTIPLLPSGKVDRKALPPPATPRLVATNTTFLAPQGPTETFLVEHWSAVLGVEQTALSVVADLFKDLGGHSLVAATLVSRLREDGRYCTGELSVPELYAHPTVRALATHLDLATHAAAETPGERQVVPTSRARTPSRRRLLGFAAAQLGWIYLVVFVAMAPIGLLYAIHDGEPSLELLQQMIVVFPLSYLLGRWALPVLAAAVVGEGITPGVYPLYGRMHLRVWIMQRIMELSPLTRLAGSPWAVPYLRWCGAQIGEHCHLGSAQIPLPGMIHLGDRVTVGYQAHLRGYTISCGQLTVGRVVVHDDAVIGTNVSLEGPCEMGPGSSLGPQSLLNAHRSVPPGEHWLGSPAAPTTRKTDPVLALMTSCDRAPRDWPRELLPRFFFSVLALELTPIAALAPVVLLVWLILVSTGEMAAFYATLASGPVFVIATCTIVLWLRRFALQVTPVGVHHMRSKLGLEKWFNDKLLEVSLELTNSLYGTLYTPHWLRTLGARVAANAEVATIANIDPDLLTLGEGSFVADMASVGSATYANGHVAFQKATVGARAFVGNASFVPGGTRLEDGSLLGVASVPPPRVDENTSWLGSPAMYLPARQMYEGYELSTTFAPPRRKVAARYVVEFFRITLPASILGASTFGTLAVLAQLAIGQLPVELIALAAPAIALLFSLLVVVFVAAVKWLLVGRYRERVEPLWSGFVRRTEFMTGLFETTAVPALLAALTGTPMLNPLLRLYGVKVGRRALIETTYITEFDLVSIGPDANIGAHASLQTHLFEDRVMKMGRVRLDASATLGSRSVVLYGARVGSDAVLAALSLAMKGETLPQATRWVGIPAQPDRHRPPTMSAPQLDPDQVTQP